MTMLHHLKYGWMEVGSLNKKLYRSSYNYIDQVIKLLISWKSKVRDSFPFLGNLITVTYQFCVNQFREAE